jgi:menaquinone-specific isochorismate synthase
VTRRPSVLDALPATLRDERIAPRTCVRTVEIPDPGPLTALLPDADDALAWIRDGEGLVAWGRTAIVHGYGTARFATAWSAWTDMVSRMDVDDRVGLPGTGPVAFTSCAFGDGDDGGPSLLVVPRVVVGRRGGRAWRTEFGNVGPRTAAPVGAIRAVGWSGGALGPDSYRGAVRDAVHRMRGDELEKVVLARDLVAHFDGPVDHRGVLAALTARHRHAWGFAVDGLVGATPEMLVSRRGGEVFSRVLAGTTWPGADPGMLATPKIRVEHAHAVDSLEAALRPFCGELELDGPKPLELPNVTHLATDVRATLPARTPGTWWPSVLHLAAALHPTAAVGGTPPALAMATIAEIEGSHGLGRGRYAGPVGWVDATGDGELGLALRCAQLSGATARLFAGCGIVAGSDPDTELAETRAKFRAVADVLDPAGAPPAA